MTLRPRLHKAGLIFILLWFIFVSQPVHSQEAVNDQQQRILPNLDVIILVDESETMWNKTDSEGIRVNTVNFIIDMLTVETSTTGHRVGIVAFGTEPNVIPYTRLDSPAAAESLKTQFAAVHQQIEVNKNLQYTDINRALEAALTMLTTEGDPTRKPAIIFISDGQPTNPQVAEKNGREVIETYLLETQKLLDKFKQVQSTVALCDNTNGTPFFTIGMGIDKLIEASTPEFIDLYREFWQSVASHTNGYYREANKLQEMQGISTYIFSELLCTPATPPVTLRESQLLEYQVYESYYQIIFTISGKDNPDLEAHIYRPQDDGTAGGKILDPNDEGVSWQSGPDYEVWRVNYGTPWLGKWQVTLEGEGQAEFSYIVFPEVGLTLEQPNSGFLPVDQPLTLQASISDEKGQPVDVPVQDIIVEIEGENYREQVRLEKTGVSYSAKLDTLSNTGEYSLTYSTILPDGTPIFEHKWITLVSAPWADLAVPQAGTTYQPDEPIPLVAQVHLAGAIPLDGIKMAATLAKDGQPVQSIELSQTDILTQGAESIVAYHGEFDRVTETGNYTVQAKLTAILPGGRVFDNQTALTPLVVMAPPTVTPSPTFSPTLSPSPTATATATTTATIVPTPTPIVVAQIVPSPSPTPTPEPTPAPSSGMDAVLASSYFWPCLGFLLLLLPILLWVFWRRRRPDTPENIKLLATLMHSRRERSEPPYLLVLGSGTSMVLGSKTMRRVVGSIAGELDLDDFHRTLDGFSARERYVMLKKHFDDTKLSAGYLRLAELIEQGYFTLIFTTNLDPFLENSLEKKAVAVNHQVVVCGRQSDPETLEMLTVTDPLVKVIKLHGDIEAREFAVTPSEISQFGSHNERILRQYLAQDLIILGPGPRDYDLNRAFDREGGAVWYVNEIPLTTENPLYQALQGRGAEDNMIEGPFGQFDRFFEALHRELKRLH